MFNNLVNIPDIKFCNKTFRMYNMYNSDGLSVQLLYRAGSIGLASIYDCIYYILMRGSQQGNFHIRDLNISDIIHAEAPSPVCGQIKWPLKVNSQCGYGFWQ